MLLWLDEPGQQCLERAFARKINADVLISSTKAKAVIVPQRLSGMLAKRPVRPEFFLMLGRSGRCESQHVAVASLNCGKPKELAARHVRCLSRQLVQTHGLVAANCLPQGLHPGPCLQVWKLPAWARGTHFQTGHDAGQHDSNLKVGYPSLPQGMEQQQSASEAP